MAASSSKTAVVIDRTEFPGSHCLRVDIPERVTMRKALFTELTQSPLLDEWINSDPETNLFISIPPTTGNPVLPQPAKLLFARGSVEGDTVSADLMVVVFRRSDETVLSDATINEHAKKDLLPIIRALKILVLSPPDMPMKIFNATAENLVYFYNVVDPSLMQPILKQRLFELETDNYIGHICANCGRIGAAFRCPCLSGVYYCGKECQRANWPAHKAHVQHKKK